jgi:hypothetical protein
MTDEQNKIADAKAKLRALAVAIGKPEVDLDNLQYNFLGNSVMLINKGNVVGMIHRQVYDALMSRSLESDSE